MVRVQQGELANDANTDYKMHPGGQGWARFFRGRGKNAPVKMDRRDAESRFVDNRGTNLDAAFKKRILSIELLKLLC